MQTAVVIPLTVSPPSVRPTSTTRLTVLLELSTSLLYICLGHLVHERSRQRCSLETIAFTAVDADRRSGEQELDTTPFVLSLGRTSRHRSRRRPRGFLLLDSEEIGVRAACCPITNSIRSIIVPLLLLCLEYLDLERSARSTRSISGGGSFLPSYVSLYYLESLAIPRLLHLYNRTVLHSHIENLAGQ